MVSIDGEVAFGEAQPKNTRRCSEGKREVCLPLAPVDCVCMAEERDRRTERSGQLSQHGVHDWRRDGSLSLVRERIAGGKV